MNKYVIHIMLIMHLLFMTYLFYPVDRMIKPFPLDESIEITPMTYIWMMWSKFIVVALVYVITEISTTHRNYLKIIFYANVIGIIDWLLIYNNTWFYFFDLPICFNLVYGVLLLSISICALKYDYRNT